MALRVSFSHFLTPMQFLRSPRNPNLNTCVVFKAIKCAVGTQSVNETVTRRSANYAPNFWDYDLVQSLSNDDYDGEKYQRHANQMKDVVRQLINQEMHPLATLELIDIVQRLGLKYHFEMEIKKNLDENGETLHDCTNLHATALAFRLLRQHGYKVSQDVFDRFKDDKGKFKALVYEDVKGLLSLYEACFFGLEGEEKLDEAKAFSREKLTQLLNKGYLPKIMSQKVEHALEMPLHWRLTRLEARWVIDMYEQEPDFNPTLLQLAKLDYNMIQSTHRKEIAILARWWVDLGLDKITFARDRLVEHYLWGAGMVHDPQFGTFRHMFTRLVCSVSLIDDCYDVYGKLDELEIFTDIIDRWDITRLDELPQELKICLLALYNTCNEVGYETLQQRGFNIIPYLSKAWADLCKTYLKEAKWYYKGYTPTLDEYMDNATTSIAAPLLLLICYLFTTKHITKEALEYIDELPTIMRCSSFILRLADDLGTSQEELARGDNVKAIQCYMHETGASEEDARKHIRGLMHQTWKKMNKVMFDQYPFSEPMITACPNLSRTAHFFYELGDGHGNASPEMKNHMTKLLLEPIPLSDI